MKKIETDTQAVETEDLTPNFVIIHSSPGQGFAANIVPAESATDRPPNSTREEFYATSPAKAQEYADGRYEGRPGEYRVFSLDKPTEEKDGGN